MALKTLVGVVVVWTTHGAVGDVCVIFGVRRWYTYVLFSASVHALRLVGCAGCFRERQTRVSDVRALSSLLHVIILSFVAGSVLVRLCFRAFRPLWRGNDTREVQL